MEADINKLKGNISCISHWLFKDKSVLEGIIRSLSPSEPKSGSQVTITRELLASIIRIFCAIILPQFDKRW